LQISIIGTSSQAEKGYSGLATDKTLPPQNSETATHWHTELQNLDDADLVGHIKSVIVWCKLHVSLLLAIRPMRQVMDQIISKETATGNLAKDARQINRVHYSKHITRSIK